MSKILPHIASLAIFLACDFLIDTAEKIRRTTARSLALAALFAALVLAAVSHESSVIGIACILSASSVVIRAVKMLKRSHGEKR